MYIIRSHLGSIMWLEPVGVQLEFAKPWLRTTMCPAPNSSLAMTTLPPQADPNLLELLVALPGGAPGMFPVTVASGHGF